MDVIEKAGINGLFAGAGTLMYFTPQAKVYMPFAGSRVPLSALAFGVGAVGSIIGDVVHKFVINEVDLSDKAKHNYSFVTGLVLNGGLFLGLLACYDRSILADFGYANALFVGSIAEFGASASYGYLKDNMIL